MIVQLLSLLDKLVDFDVYLLKIMRDVSLAKEVIAYDDVVDGYFDDVKTNLIVQFGNLKADGEKVLDLLTIAKYFERMGDHASEIAKWILFSITGNKEG